MVDLFEIGEILPNGTFRLYDGLREYKRIRQTTAQKNFLANNGLQFVNSSALSAIGMQDNDLLIRFHNGSMYLYNNGAIKFDDLLNSNSKGKYFNKQIKGKYSFKRLGKLSFPQSLQTVETAEMELLSDDEIFNTIETREFKQLISNLENPQINFNVAVDKSGNELLQILINGVAIYYLMETVLQKAKVSKNEYLERLGITI